MVGEKEKKAMTQIKDHMELVGSCCETLKDAYDTYIEGDMERFEEYAKWMREKETEADDARRRVELSIHSGAFMPIYREDYLNLAELVDKVADNCILATNLLSFTQIDIPEEARGRIAGLVEKTIECVDALDETISLSMKDRKKVDEGAHRVEQLEEAIDDQEYQLRSFLYRMPIDGYHKLLLNDLVEKIGSISDAAEDASDRIVIMLSKRI